MDIARIEKRVGVRATTDRIWELISDLPTWERWNPVERAVAALGRTVPPNVASRSESAMARSSASTAGTAAVP